MKKRTGAKPQAKRPDHHPVYKYLVAERCFHRLRLFDPKTDTDAVSFDIEKGVPPHYFVPLDGGPVMKPVIDPETGKRRSEEVWPDPGDVQLPRVPENPADKPQTLDEYRNEKLGGKPLGMPPKEASD